MLAPDGRPPTFRLPDGRGQTAALADFLGRRRIVLAFNPDGTAADALAGETDGLNDRDMVALIILPPGHPLSSASSPPPIWTLIDEGSRVAAAYGAPAEGSLFCLIGKDGTIKQSGPTVPTPAELFETVDVMPMRRREMREKGGHG